MSENEILNLIIDGDEEMRPNIDVLRDVAESMDSELPEFIVSLMQDCWAEDPDTRPDFANHRREP